MKKYILKKDLPAAKAGTKVYVDDENLALYLGWETGTVHPNVANAIQVRDMLLSGDWLEEVKDEVKQTPKSGLFLPKDGECYWTAVASGYWTNQWKGDGIDGEIFANSGCFRTEEEARQHAKYLQALFEVKKWIVENLEPFEPDWEDDGQSKYQVYYDHDRRKLGAWDFIMVRSLTILPYLKSEQDCLNLITAQKENLKAIFGVKE